MIVATNSLLIAMGSSIVIYAFIFSLTCFRVRKISHAHPGGYTLKPREEYQEAITSSFVWFAGFLASLLWILTIKGVFSMLFNRKPPLKTGAEYFKYALIMSWMDLLYDYDLLISVLVAVEFWRLP